MKKCDSCGKPYAASKDVFCPHCGAVASEKCTHGSIYDSSRYDRGELYDTPNKYVYNQGAEPHAQREPLNKGHSNQPGAPYTLDLPKILKNDSFKKFRSVLVSIFMIVAFVIGVVNVAYNETNYESFADDQYYDGEYDYENDYYYAKAQTESAVVLANVYNDMWFDFNVVLGNLYFENAQNKFVAEYAEDLLGNQCHAQFDMITLDDPEFEMYEFEEAIEYAWNIQSDNESDAGYYEFQEITQEIGQIIYIEDFSIVTDYGDIYLDLPFDAFSCDEEGNITYYEKEDMSSSIRLVECQPEKTLDSDAFELYISFSDGELIRNFNESEYSVVTEVVSVNAQ